MDYSSSRRHGDAQHAHDDWEQVHNDWLGVQKKSTQISSPEDEHEKEADTVARKVANGESASVKGKTGSLSRKASGSAEASPGFQQQLQASEGGGQSLDKETRTDLESKMNADFSGVRIHTGAEANQLSDSISAKAFTKGQDIYFGQGQFNPQSKGGKELLAHELAHTQQQANASGQLISRQPKEEPWVKDQDGNLYYKTEAEANTRMANLKKKGEWKEYHVVSFQTSDKTTYWRVEMRTPVKNEDDKPSDKPVVKEKPTDDNANKGTKTTTGVTRQIALTFDDGPHAATLGNGTNLTEKVLDTMKAKSAHGGFFIQTGVSFRGASTVGKELVKRMHDEGHDVGVHTGGTADHEDHTDANADGRLEKELLSGKEYIKTQTGVTPTYVRPPHGRHNADVDKVYDKVKLKNLMWDIDGDQGKNLALDELKKRIDSGLTTLKNNGWKTTTASSKIVFLYHDIQKGSANNLGAIMEHIKDKVKELSGNADSVSFEKP